MHRPAAAASVAAFYNVRSRRNPAHCEIAQDNYSKAEAQSWFGGFTNSGFRKTAWPAGASTTSTSDKKNSNFNFFNSPSPGSNTSISSPPAAGSWPKYDYEQFIKLGKNGERIVVAYDGKIFDVTDFSGHPGGVGRLEMAAGKDLAVFWKVYTQHNRGHVVNDILSVYQIGEFLTEDDMKKVTDSTWYDDSLFRNDVFYSDLLVNTLHPYNAEAKLRYLTDHFVTPIGKHFVRNHNHVPHIDPEEYTLTVLGEGLQGETVWTLEDLKTKFEKHSVTTVIQCNGNRREDYHFNEHGPGRRGGALMLIQGG